MSQSRNASSAERHEQAFFARQFTVAAAGVVYWLTSRSPGASALPYAPILLAVVLNVMYYALAAKRAFYPHVRWIQIPLDLALWTWLIHLTGGPWSMFYPLYAFEIMLSAVTLSVTGCVYASALSVLFYTLEAAGWPGQIAVSIVAPRLALFAGTGAVCAVLVRKLAANENIVRGLNERLRRRVHVVATEQNAILESMTCGLLGVDVEGKVTMFNRKAEEILGLKAADVLGRPCGSAPGEEGSRSAAALAKLCDERRPGRREFDLVLKGRTAHLAASLFELPEGFPTSSVYIFQDLTELRDLEQRTIRAETLSGLGAMAATLAHELRTPLTAIAGFAALLRERLEGNPGSAEIAEKIERGVMSLEQVTQQLLDFTDSPDLAKSRVRVADVVTSGLELLPPKSREMVKLCITDSGASALVLGDPLQLRQAVLNLMLNASEAAGDGGEVRVTLREDGGDASLEVADTGPGVPEELRNKIFLPFFTTKRGGTGLGLSYSEKLIRAHGGRLTLDGPAGGGAVFTVRLRLLEEAERETQAKGQARLQGPSRVKRAERPGAEEARDQAPRPISPA
jgi:PAS domain S-box-containing protein